MPKQLRIKSVDSAFCMTRRELVGWLQTNPGFSDDSTIVLRCNGKNFRLAAFQTVAGRPVLIGKRGKND